MMLKELLYAQYFSSLIVEEAAAYQIIPQSSFWWARQVELPDFLQRIIPWLSNWFGAHSFTSLLTFPKTADNMDVRNTLNIPSLVSSVLHTDVIFFLIDSCFILGFEVLGFLWRTHPRLQTFFSRSIEHLHLTLHCLSPQPLLIFQDTDPSCSCFGAGSPVLCWESHSVSCPGTCLILALYFLVSVTLWEQRDARGID